MSPTAIFNPASTPAAAIAGLFLLVLAVTGAIFVVVAGLLVYAVVRFRRVDDATAEPAQVYGSNQVELAWTVVPMLIVVVLFLATARVITRVQRTDRPDEAVQVVAVGHQFWWEYRYPGLNVVTANELHVPVSDSRHETPTFITLLSADTDHSFWIPRLAGKTDLIPNKVNSMWIEPERPGLYLGQCAKYCGTQHAKMLLRVYVDTREDFDRWVKQQEKPSESSPTTAAGKLVFERTACINCHSVSGTVGDGRFGPDLTHMMSRDTLGSGALSNSPQGLRAWIKSPDQFKPGVLMPAMNLNDADLDQLVAYLTTLK